LPISALQHLVFCERQCALIHVEGIWRENRLTAEGRELHEHAHEPGFESRGARRTVRSLRLVSLEFGITGIADIVEFEAPPGSSAKDLSDPTRRLQEGALVGWRVRPVEYKRGSPKGNSCDAVQLCAQAFCLEEALRIPVLSGAIFYGEERRREIIDFSESLRTETRLACSRLHDIVERRVVPKGIYSAACRSCSLVEECLPRVTRSAASAGQYMRRAIEERLTDDGLVGDIAP
jgi:CRISPR-associated exonuclease Cas4